MQDVTGVCNDGAPNPDGSINTNAVACTIGTDCQDCGVRSLCLNCPTTCQERNNQLGDMSKACFAHNIDNGLCDAGCNVLECGYDVTTLGKQACTTTQIENSCLKGQDSSAADYTTAPLTGYGSSVNEAMAAYKTTNASDDRVVAAVARVPVALQLSLEAARLQLHPDFNEIYVLQEMDYNLTWRDHRLATSPCAGALPTILSLSREAGASETERTRKRAISDRYWMPKFTVKDMLPGYDAWDETADFTMADKAAYQEIGDPLSSSYVETLDSSTAYPNLGWVTYVGNLEIQTLQPSFVSNYFNYPFDHQVMEWLMSVGTAAGNDVFLFTCYGGGRTSPVINNSMDLSVVDLNSVFLPASSEWMLDGDLEDAVTFSHPTENGEPVLNRCVINVKIYRNPVVYFLKGLVLTISVVLSCLLVAGYLDPHECIGDRCGCLFIGFLILVTNMQTDIGLGRVANLLWLDIFNLIQLALVLVSCLETMVVHNLIKQSRVALATHIDQSARVIIPWGLYPVVTLASIFGFTDKDAAIACGSVGIPVCLIVLVIVVKRSMNQMRIKQLNTVTAFQNCSPDDPKWEQCTTNVFNAFDLDGSGHVDEDEFRTLLNVVHPALPRRLAASTLSEIQHMFGRDGMLSQATFIDAMLLAKRHIEAHAEEMGYTHSEASEYDMRIDIIRGKTRAPSYVTSPGKLREQRSTSKLEKMCGPSVARVVKKAERAIEKKWDKAIGVQDMNKMKRKSCAVVEAQTWTSDTKDSVSHTA